MKRTGQRYTWWVVVSVCVKQEQASELQNNAGDNGKNEIPWRWWCFVDDKIIEVWIAEEGSCLKSILLSIQSLFSMISCALFFFPELLKDSRSNFLQHRFKNFSGRWSCQHNFKFHTNQFVYPLHSQEPRLCATTVNDFRSILNKCALQTWWCSNTIQWRELQERQ